MVATMRQVTRGMQTSLATVSWIPLGQLEIENHGNGLWVSRGDLENIGRQQGTIICRHLRL